MAIDPLNEELDKEDSTKFTLDQISPVEIVKGLCSPSSQMHLRFRECYVMPEPQFGLHHVIRHYLVNKLFLRELGINDPRDSNSLL